jgi:hypothetical protein
LHHISVIAKIQRIRATLIFKNQPVSTESGRGKIDQNQLKIKINPFPLNLTDLVGKSALNRNRWPWNFYCRRILNLIRIVLPETRSSYPWAAALAKSRISTELPVSFPSPNPQIPNPSPHRHLVAAATMLRSPGHSPRELSPSPSPAPATPRPASPTPSTASASTLSTRYHHLLEAPAL